MKITILGVPMAKQGFMFTRKGIRYQKPEIKNWAAQAKLQVINQLPEEFKLFDGPIVIKNLSFVFPMLKNTPKYKKKMVEEGINLFKDTKPDMDNLQKNTWDVCEGILFTNDSRIVLIEKMKKIYGLKPRIEFEIVEVEK